MDEMVEYRPPGGGVEAMCACLELRELGLQWHHVNYKYDLCVAGVGGRRRVEGSKRES